MIKPKVNIKLQHEADKIVGFYFYERAPFFETISWIVIFVSLLTGVTGVTGVK